MNLQVMNSNGEYENLQNQEKIQEDLEQNIGQDLSESSKKWLSRYIEETVSLAMNVGRKEAEVRGSSNMKKVLVAAAASALFSFISVAIVAMKTYGLM